MKVIKRYYYLARLDLVGVVALFVAGFVFIGHGVAVGAR